MPSGREKSSENGLTNPTRKSGLELSAAAIQHLFDLVKTNRTRKQISLSAFEALIAIGGYWRFASSEKMANPQWEPYPEALVAVPWWIVDNLAQAWISYLYAPSGKTFGETLGIEGGGQGQRPAKERWVIYRRDLILALKVQEIRIQSERRGKRTTYEAAFDKVAEESNSSEDIVRRAWKKHRRKLMGA